MHKPVARPDVALAIPIEAAFFAAIGLPAIDHEGNLYPDPPGLSDGARRFLGVLCVHTLEDRQPGMVRLAKHLLERKWPGLYPEEAAPWPEMDRPATMEDLKSFLARIDHEK